MKINNSTYILILIFTSGLLAGCANKNAFFLKQGYHDITSHYNSYFNAKELYNLTLKSIEESRKENFDEILPLYAYGTLEDTKSRDGEFTTVIDKSSKSIQLHKVSNWSDDNFLLLGKAFFMKGQYDKATESLRYVTANFKDGVDGRSDKKIKKQKSNKKRKAKAKKLAKKNVQKQKNGIDIRPKKNILVHEPTKSEALIWLVKAFSANDQFSEAASVLDYISSDNSFIQNYDRETELAYTYYLIEQKQYSGAILHLENAISMFKSKKKTARYKYVLAQILEKTGNKKDASKYFIESIKGNNNYDMVFNAKLNSIKLSNGSSSDKEDKFLSKLIKDSKNADYLDQLYYEKALISLTNKDEKEAINFLEKSIEASTINQKQKAKSHLLLAEIFYNKEDYLVSQENYAACLALITPEFKNYKTISKRATVLTGLVDELNLIKKNDELLLIAELPQDEIEAKLYQQAVDVIDAEKAALENNTIIDQFAANDKVSKNGKWYFYNETAKTIGYSKFIKKWENRQLEDNWRRENKNSSNTLTEDVKTEDEMDEEKIDALYKQLLAEIPNSDSSKSKFSNAVASAHYNAANYYKYDLDNDTKAIAHYNVIAKKYTASNYEAESLFNLYLLNKKIDNITASTKNKNLVLSKYPKSKYAEIIKDPNYAMESKGDSEAVEKYYEDTYNKFVAEDFVTVIDRVAKSKTQFPSNKLAAKFALLEAITLGKQKKYQPYVSSLENVITTYKNTEEEAKATELLAYLKGDFTKVKTSSDTKDVEDDKKEDKTNGLFDSNKDKDKEGFKVQFGKKDILKVGTNDANEKKNSTSKTNKINPANTDSKSDKLEEK
ncbi:MAG: tetratricopeptide (TPR) repeat protein [Planctomycetota bacterium]|jgi:tetratricopeptide (TPR) repeat protein